MNKASIKKRIKDIELFLNALENIEDASKLKKSLPKERVNFTIDGNLMAMFRDYCGKNSISMSNKVESLIRRYLEKGGKG